MIEGLDMKLQKIIKYDGLHNKYEYYVDENNKMNGICKCYYPNNELCFKEKYIDGVLHGTQKYFYDNGKIREIRTYHLGKKDGKFEMFFINGKKAVSDYYIEEARISRDVYKEYKKRRMME